LLISAAIIDVATTIPVAVVALARLLCDPADKRARNAANRCANCRAAHVAGDYAADNGTRRSADTGTLLGGCAACDRKADQREYEDFSHLFSPRFLAPQRADVVPNLFFLRLARKLCRKKGLSTINKLFFVRREFLSTIKSEFVAGIDVDQFP
jgi:hypothetical protein